MLHFFLDISFTDLADQEQQVFICFLALRTIQELVLAFVVEGVSARENMGHYLLRVQQILARTADLH